MSDFERRRQSSEHSDGARAGDAHATPGKTTRTAALQHHATRFSAKDLTDKKLHTNSGTAATLQGPAFGKWLETCRDHFAKKHSTRRVAGRAVVGEPQHAQASEGRR